MRHSFVVFLVIISLGSLIIGLGNQPSKDLSFVGITGSSFVDLFNYSFTSLICGDSLTLTSPNSHRVSPSSNVTLSALPSLNLANAQSSFEGLYYGYKSNKYVPSDVQIAAGPYHIVQMVNVLVGVYAKNGSLLQAVDLNSFFHVGTDNVTDPRVFYDSISGRWFASVLDITTDKVEIATSSSDNPFGNWYVHAFSSNVLGYLPDEPVLSVASDKVVVSANEYDRFGSFVGAEFWVVNKSELIVGGPVNYVDFGPYVDYLSIYPATNLASTQNQYMVSVDPGISGSFVLFSLVGTPPGSVTVVNTTLFIKNSSPPVNGIQPSTRRTVDVSDGRVLSAVWYQSRLWFAFADSAVPSGDTLLRSSFRLVQVNTDTNTVLQDFDVNAAGFSYFYPALAVDGEENLFVLFGYSSPNDYPGLMVTGQARTDTTGTYRNPLAILQGTGPELSGRYGDYFGAAVDPSSPLVVWGAGQYGTMNGWATHIVSIISSLVIPEFPRFLIIPLFMAVCVLAVVLAKRRFHEKLKS